MTTGSQPAYATRRVDEAWLDPSLRCHLGHLLCAILDEGPRYLERAWRTLPPTFRVVAFAPGDEVVGQASCFRVMTHPRAELYGVGDVAVAPSHRLRGLARRMCREVVAECRRRRGDAVLVKTKPLRPVFTELGFVAVESFDFFWEDQRGCHRHPDWMVARRCESSQRLWVVQGDF